MMAIKVSILLISLVVSQSYAQYGFFEDVETADQECGQRLPVVNVRVSGDDTSTAFGEFPWMVAIFNSSIIKNRKYFKYRCGGSIIAPNVVLTAAHCLRDKKPYELLVRAGDWDLSNDNELLKAVDMQVQEIVMHENFDSRNVYNDFALLILKRSFTWEEHISPICLPKQNIKYDYKGCVATGWGKTTEYGDYQNILLKTELPVVPPKTCQENLRKIGLGEHFVLDKSFLCAGGEKDTDTCEGDGGSPLICPIPGHDDRYYQAGIVSWGVGCNIQNVPGVYADVAYARQWISDELAARGIQYI